MNGMLSVDELMAKMAKAQADKKAAAAKVHDAEEEKRKALLQALTNPSGLSDEQFLEKASILVNRAVENGESAVEVFRFPHALCTDNGRALNQVEPGWENTLVGVPKEIYEFWGRQLRPKGYHIRFEIVDYPGGMPGEVGI